MWGPLLRWTGNLAERRGGTVIVVVFAVSLAMAAAIPGLRISSSYRDLMPKDRPEQRAYDAFLEEFGAANDLIVVLEGEPAVIREASDRLAEELSRTGDPVAGVFHRFDPAFLAARGPLYLDASTLRQVAEAVTGGRPLLETLGETRGMPELLQTVAGVIVDPPPSTAGASAEGERFIEAISLFLGAWENRLDGEPAMPTEGVTIEDWIPESRASDLALLRKLAGGGGYPGSHDQRMVFLFVQPVLPSDDPAYLVEVENAVRSAWETVRGGGGSQMEGVTFALTGLPAHILSDVRSLRQDLIRAGVPSAVLIFLILWLGLRSVRRTCIALLALGCGLAISLGLVRFLFVELNRMSVSFLAIMFGIGIDFAIYLIRRSDEEIAKGQDRVAAVKDALATSGRGIVSGGLITALAFSVTALSAFRGTSQLGLTTALSVVVVLVVTLFLLPPLLMRTRPPARIPLADPERSPAKALGAGRLSRVFALVALVVVAAITGLGFWAGWRVPLDFNGLTVMPHGAESTVYQEKMEIRSDYQMTSAAIRSTDSEDLADKVRRIREKPTVARVVTIGDLVPPRQDEALAILAEYPGLFTWKLPRLHEEAVEPGDYESALAVLEDALYGAQELAFTGGQAELVEALQLAIDRAAKVGQHLAERPEEAGEITDGFVREMQGWIDRAEEMLVRWQSLELVSEEDLPPGLLQRFRSERGHYAAFIYPADSIWETAFLGAFLDDLRSVDPGVTGFPVVSESNIRLLTRGILQSLVLTVIVVVVLLAIDLRNPRHVLSALVPLLTGMSLLQLLLFLTGQQYNLASINGLPLLLGLGVVYGVHLVRRWSEMPGASAFEAVETSGRAILLAGFTTMAGLASLAFCIHRGVATFGLLLLQGIVCMLVATLVVLPLVIDAVTRYVAGRDERQAARARSGK